MYVYGFQPLGLHGRSVLCIEWIPQAFKQEQIKKDMSNYPIKLLPFSVHFFSTSSGPACKQFINEERMAARMNNLNISSGSNSTQGQYDYTLSNFEIRHGVIAYLEQVTIEHACSVWYRGKTHAFYRLLTAKHVIYCGQHHV